MANNSSTRDLKRVLGFSDLMGAAVGQIIGAGVMTLLGVGIGMTGRSITLALFVAAVLVIGCALPVIVLGGTVRLRGGQYTMGALLVGEKFAGMFTIMYIFSNVSIAMYPLSFAQYFGDFFGIAGMGSEKAIALLCLTFFFVLNVLGIDKMSKVQKLVVFCMVVALGMFGAFGITKVQPGFFGEGFMTHGMLGLLSTGGLFYFAVGGATTIINLSGEAKNPTRDIPLTIVCSTLGVACIYCVIAVVASGVLPIEQVANQPLTLVAKAVMPKACFAFFMICGAMFALISTLNSQLAWSTKPVLQACDDGWLPKWLGYLHPKYKTPTVLLCIVYGTGVICIVTGLSIAVLGNMALVLSSITNIIINVAILRLPKLVPEAWAKSKFRVSKTVLVMIAVVSGLAAAATCYLNAIQLERALLYGNILIFVISLGYAAFRWRSGKVHMDISYEER